MRVRLSGLVPLSRGGLFLAALAVSPPARAAALTMISPRHLDLHFVRNEGQADPAVAYSARTFAGTVFVTGAGEIVHALSSRGGPGWTLTERLVDGRAVPAVEECSTARASFLLGNDPSRWRDGVETSDSVTFGEVWPGVHLELRSRDRTVEKVFTIAPAADPARIRVRLEGARSLSVDESGSLVAETGLGLVSFSAPFAYQTNGEAREAVPVSYVLRGGEYGFQLGAHDPARPVVIDPILQSTYVGGSGGFDQVDEIAFHPTSGNVYVAGFTNSTNFPGTTGGAQSAHGADSGSQDAFVAEVPLDLTPTLLQATYRCSAYDIAEGLAISSDCALDLRHRRDRPPRTFRSWAARRRPMPAAATPLSSASTRASTGAFKSTYLGGTANDHGSRSIAVDACTGKAFAGGWGESKTSQC